jgi:anaerobic ribonucleoside-triphosphate reductase activating protein
MQDKGRREFVHAETETTCPQGHQLVVGSAQNPRRLTVRVASVCSRTLVLGPGERAAVWVQGCPFSCRGCIAPEWIPVDGGTLWDPEDLAAELLNDSRTTGVTLSGGEPMAQAAALAATVRAVRRRRDVDILCFTGYRLETLVTGSVVPGATELLSEVDLLIDGAYVEGLDDGVGLRGSRNQRFHELTGRIDARELADARREFEIHARPHPDGIDVNLVGIPPPGLLRALSSQVDAFLNAVPNRRASKEWP